MTPRRVLVLRHGRTAWNAERRFQGHADPPLDDVGRAQAHDVAQIIAAVAPEALVSSDALRCVQTARVVGEVTGLTPGIDGRLRERGLGHWEGLTRDEVAARHPDEYATWVAGGDVYRPGGETREQVRDRAIAAFADLPDAATTVLVTHGATSMTLVGALLGLPLELRPFGPLANCHWAELTAEPGRGWLLRGHNLGSLGGVVPWPVAPSGVTSDDGDDTP